jgi:hypothetical protein
MRERLTRALKSTIYDETLKREKSFIWKKENLLKNFRIPGDDVKRATQFISSQEISQAILYLVEDQFGMMRDQIPHAIIKTFGIARIDPEEINRIREITDKLVEEKQLVLSGNQVYLS